MKEKIEEALNIVKEMQKCRNGGEEKKPYDTHYESEPPKQMPYSPFEYGQAMDVLINFTEEQIKTL